MLKYTDANEILMNEFEAMKTAFYEDEEKSVFVTEHGCHAFYCTLFAPYVIKQLDDDNEEELQKIFKFIEKLFVEGDEDLANLAGASIVEDVYYDVDFEKEKDRIFSLCGPKTRRSFELMDSE